MVNFFNVGLFLLIIAAIFLTGSSALNKSCLMTIDAHNEKNFYELHPNLVVAGLRSDSLVVYHNRSKPYEVSLNAKPPYPVRLFLKSNLTISTVEIIFDDVLITEYQLRGDKIVLLGNYSGNSMIPSQVTDSPEGFYNSFTCQLLKTKQELSTCNCSLGRDSNEICFYDSLRDEFVKMYRRTGIYNYYNCMYFHRNDEVSEERNGRKIKFTTAFASDTPSPSGNGICINVENSDGHAFHELQFYDLNWDYMPHEEWKICNLSKIALLADDFSRFAEVELTTAKNVEQPTTPKQNGAVGRPRFPALLFFFSVWALWRFAPENSVRMLTT